MLELVREYALERLVESGEVDEVRARHGAYYVGLAEEAEAELGVRGSGPGTSASSGSCRACGRPSTG